MSKLVKIFYRVDNHIDFNCLDKCPFGEKPMCGSSACVSCKNCIGHGKMNVWTLEKPKGMVFGQGYIICNKVYEKPNLEMRLMRLIHVIKLKIKSN